MTDQHTLAADLRTIAEKVDALELATPALDGGPGLAAPTEVTSPVPGTDATVVTADEAGSMQKIADRLQVDVDALRALNAGHLGSSPELPAGTVVAVPATSSDQAAASSSDQAPAQADQTAAASSDQAAASSSDQAPAQADQAAAASSDQAAAASSDQAAAQADQTAAPSSAQAPAASFDAAVAAVETQTTQQEGATDGHS